MPAEMSVSDLAAAHKVTKQAISKNLKKFGARVPTRKDGVRLMVDVEAYDRLAATETDPAQALRNRDVNPNAAQSTLPLGASGENDRQNGSSSEAFSAHRARREGYDAELSRIALERQMAQLVPVAEVENAMVKCAQNLVRIIDSLPGKSDDPQVRPFLKQIAQEMREALFLDMRHLAETADDEEGDA